MFSLLDVLGPSARGADLEAAILTLAQTGEADRGAVFTKPEIVHAILDLCGYSADFRLQNMTLLEPCFGQGDFLFAAVRRLITSYTSHGGDLASASVELAPCIRAVELHERSYNETNSLLHALLLQLGMDALNAKKLCDQWLVHDDFLLVVIPGKFDFVVGNPPYVRQEKLPATLVKEYRSRYWTMYDRADLYIAFFEKSLDLLSQNGVLGFVCANRWIKNKYGGPLRSKIVKSFSVRYYIDLEGINAFFSDVEAYPAIIVIQNPAGGITLAARAGSLKALTDVPVVVQAMMSKQPDVHTVGKVQLGETRDAPWIIEDLDQLGLVRKIEHLFPALEDAGCKVGIGVATGCDRVYIGEYHSLPVEQSRKVRLVMAKDLANGIVQWGGNGVINPFEPDGSLVNLSEYPLFADYLYRNREAVSGRHVAKRSPDGWFRTIDRINPALIATPKILVPDIKGSANFVLDPGCYYPHHNLYYVTSAEWGLRELQVVLRSSICLLLVSTYCTRMSGGFLRFQAQYLRRIRVPNWRSVPRPTRLALSEASFSDDIGLIDEVVFDLFKLSAAERLLAKKVAANSLPASKRRSTIQ